jgi:hypothetical protein
MITFAKMISFMETIATERNTATRKAKPHKKAAETKKAPEKVQTVLRISPELMRRVKYKARQVDVSVNAYIEDVLREAVMPKIPTLPEDFEIDPVIKSLSGIIPMRTPTQKELEEDPKFAYLYEKYLKV